MDKLIPLLEQLSKKLGVAVDVLWAALVKQARIEGISWIVFYVFTIICVAAALILLRNLFHKKAVWENAHDDEVGRGYTYQWDEHSGEIVLVSIVGALAFIVLLVAVCSLDDSIACFTNPEYIALKKVLTALSSGV